MSLLDGATTLVSSGFMVQLRFCLRAHPDGRTDAFEVGALCCFCLSTVQGLGFVWFCLRHSTQLKISYASK
jgi:hypothetical protein